jgi:hypothetical protein
LRNGGTEHGEWEKGRMGERVNGKKGEKIKAMNNV